MWRLKSVTMSTRCSPTPLPPFPSNRTISDSTPGVSRNVCPSENDATVFHLSSFILILSQSQKRVRHYSLEKTLYRQLRLNESKSGVFVLRKGAERIWCTWCTCWNPLNFASLIELLIFHNGNWLMSPLSRASIIEMLIHHESVLISSPSPQVIAPQQLHSEIRKCLPEHCEKFFFNCSLATEWDEVSVRFHFPLYSSRNPWAHSVDANAITSTSASTSVSSSSGVIAQ